MNIEQLRKHVIGCNTLDEMRQVWETLKGIGEIMARSEFNYPVAFNLGVINKYSSWGRVGIRTFTLSFQDFMAEFGTPIFDRDWLRKQVIGGFKSLDEMREAWELLRSVGENTALKTFVYHKNSNFVFCEYEGEWVTSFQLHTFTLSELKDALTMSPVCCPDAPIITHDCDLHWSVIQNCCLKCHPEQDVRNNTNLWGLLDEERRHQEFIAEVKRGKRHDS
jgi:hypothetical protein